MAARKKGGLKLNLRKGALTRKAKKAGMGVQAYARKERRAPGRTGKQARLALAMRKWNRGRKKRGAPRRSKRTRSR